MEKKEENLNKKKQICWHSILINIDTICMRTNRGRGEFFGCSQCVCVCKFSFIGVLPWCPHVSLSHPSNKRSNDGDGGRYILVIK